MQMSPQEFDVEYGISNSLSLSFPSLYRSFEHFFIFQLSDNVDLLRRRLNIPLKTAE
jgi:hypothetical protein